MYKSLYHKKYFTYTGKANKIFNEFSRFISPIIKKHLNDGYSPRQIAAICHDAISYNESVICLEHSTKLRKKGRGGKENG